MVAENYQNLVIGSGVGGKLVGWSLAKRGQKTVVVERAMIGGACPNVACLPSKNVIYSAKAVSLVDPKNGLGVTTGQVQVNMAGVVKRKRQMVEGLVQMHLDNFKASGAELVMGNAHFVESKTVEVMLNGGGSRQLRGDRVFLGLGSRATIPPVSGLADAQPLTHVEALNLARVPDHLVIVGGGYVGLEFAQAMRRFGSRVTMVQRGKQLLEREDADIATAVEELMQDEGIAVLLQAEILDVAGRSGAGVKIRVRVGASEKTLEASDILVAAGRTPNTDKIDLDKTGVELDSRGYIRVNDQLQTSAADVWAMGDCAGSPPFTHVGEDDARVVLSNLDGGNRTTRDRLIPYCLFIDPELAHVGLHESEAKAKRVSYRLIKFPMSGVLRTRTLSQTRGFAKALIGTDDHILGFTAFGAEASEMMAVVQTAMMGRLPYTALRDAIYTHPTAAEGLIGMFSSPLVNLERH
ncbi:MAG TPA: FAD-dependent oxidoreductase [Pirellulales bacterium]|jgi:pyruvate/2-oxoglutarate dehydrogenase complex dihydrolipoamide dehydrogenase (E3) component